MRWRLPSCARAVMEDNMGDQEDMGRSLRLRDAKFMATTVVLGSLLLA